MGVKIPVSPPAHKLVATLICMHTDYKQILKPDAAPCRLIMPKQSTQHVINTPYKIGSLMTWLAKVTAVSGQCCDRCNNTHQHVMNVLDTPWAESDS